MPGRNKFRPSAAQIEVLLNGDDTEDSGHMSPTAYFYVGQRVMITENVATALGAANGAQGTIVAIKFNDDDTRPQKRVELVAGISPLVTVCDMLPEVVLVKLSNSSATPLCRLPSLPADVFPVFPSKSTLSTTLGSKTVSVKMTQFPLVPTSAITVHKVQGQSLDKIVVTKWRDPIMHNQYAMTAYVSLSRVRQLTGLYTTSKLTIDDVKFFVPPISVINELERLDKLQPPEFQTDDAEWRRRRAAQTQQQHQQQQQQQQQAKRRSTKKRKRN
jgi:ATP-dependent exoDNAse (exonuclease V) alpha subunit